MAATGEIETPEPPSGDEPPEELDDYVIGRLIGRGETGAVYAAEDTMLRRAVAIKFVPARSAAARQQLLLEGRAAASFQHPNVAMVLRSAALEERPFIVTELVRGTSLAKVPQPMAGEAALEIAIGLARGLAAAHRANVVHCDLKPANVIVSDDGTAKIIDFGLARVITEGGAQAGIPVGTPDYMAPEVWRGSAPGRRSDVYSLGALLFELLAGRPPFGHVPAAELREAVLTTDAPAVRDLAPGVDPRLAEVVARCLRREPEQRFDSGDELREALEGLHSSRRHAVRPGENPYRGLRVFEAAHRGVFFGRSSEIDTVVERLRAEPMVIVTGDSGVGKSSLCRAGVIPQVLDGALGGGALWTELTVVPGRRPLRALGAALGDPSLGDRLLEAPELLPRELRRFAGERHLIIFFDQLEELITIGDPAEVAALDAALAPIREGQPSIRILASVRADFLSRLATVPRLGRDLSRLLYFLRPLPPERLREVIVGPAAATGTSFESEEIVQSLIAATAQAGDGGLPLLSFALADLWEARDEDRVITHEVVEKMGGVAGALSRHADVVLDEMRGNRTRARAVLMRLVSSMGTRTRRTAAELALDERGQAALERLVAGRLVVTHDSEAGPTYELAHEVLLTGWGTLRAWLDVDAEDRERRERLATATAEWLRLGRSADAVWQGARLDEGRALDAASLSADERAFLAASVRVRRRRRRTRWGIVLGAVVFVVLAFAIEASLERRRLDEAVEKELREARTASAEARGAERRYTVQASRAFEAFDLAQRVQAEQIWSAALAERALAVRSYRTAGQHVEVALAKDPTRADVRDLLGDILLERAQLAERNRQLEDSEELITRLALYDRDGSRLASWNRTGRVHVKVPPDAKVSIEPGSYLGTGPLEIALKPGSYVFVVEAPARALVRAPVLVERDKDLTLDVQPPRAAEVPAGFIYIPAGEFLFGNESEEDRRTFFDTQPLRPRRTNAFLIGRYEVTFAEWLQYVDKLTPFREDLLPGVPGRLTGANAITRDERGRWRLELRARNQTYAASWGEPLVYTGRTSMVSQDWRRFPVTGISPAQAAEYAAWLDSTQRIPGARLCSEVEWERAARGADGRRYPGGALLDPAHANLDRTHGPDLMGPDEVGSHPASNSPFGLTDTAGNAFEITLSEDEGFMLRSGSYFHDLKTANLTNRSTFNEGARDPSVGFRLCATPSVSPRQP